MANHLINEYSPYLQQHANNPVAWYPWGEEAFKKAKAENKPIFLSIGYSACHWCHVMARESFENEATARILNEHFIAIKVDREERPDIDKHFQEIYQLMNGRPGGWPASIFMTEELKPIYAATYLPPEPKYGLTSCASLLEMIAEKFRTNTATFIEKADEILSFLNPVTTKLEATKLDESIISRS
ncbi:MAG TPA: thioredoxin domain-containing protein, partial [Epsilonproteobacteria bacterium]|nr:thioredoxin domain-containing protein [Campylobacterota bacterium]